MSVFKGVPVPAGMHAQRYIEHSEVAYVLVWSVIAVLALLATVLAACARGHEIAKGLRTMLALFSILALVTGSLLAVLGISVAWEGEKAIGGGLCLISCGLLLIARGCFGGHAFKRTTIPP